MIIDLAGNSLPQIRAGTIKAFAVTDSKRLPAAPDIPTVDEAGVHGLYVSTWHAFYVPKGDANGETHFREIEIELAETGPDGTTSKLFPAKGIMFRTTPANWFFDWHRATRRQYVVNLDAPHQVTASDGETRTIGMGEIILYEEQHGKGHLSQGLG